MALVSLTCPNCGSKLDIEDHGKNFYFCSFCGSKIINERPEINIYGDVRMESLYTVDSLVDRGYIHLENSKWRDARRCFDQALNASPYNGRAHVGILLSECECRSIKSTEQSFRPLHFCDGYQNAVRYADEPDANLIREINSRITARYNAVVKEQNKLSSDLSGLQLEYYELMKQKPGNNRTWAAVVGAILLVTALATISLAGDNLAAWLLCFLIPALVFGGIFALNMVKKIRITNMADAKQAEIKKVEARLKELNSQIY